MSLSQKIENYSTVQNFSQLQAANNGIHETLPKEWKIPPIFPGIVTFIQKDRAHVSVENGLINIIKLNLASQE